MINWLRANKAYRILLLNPEGLQCDQIYINKPIYSLRAGDVTGDKADEIIIGVIKKTRFDQAIKRRIYILTVRSGKITPVFLCSRTIHQLVECGAAGDGSGKLLTMEKKPNGTFCVARYTWQKFGFAFTNYVFQSNDSIICKRRFNHDVR
ncbi:MAG: hypothetical protein LWX56_14010 [Ignavibacteria bacterium]|nr:hypothetical protein [Ignavibacteria bacterium]